MVFKLVSKAWYLNWLVTGGILTGYYSVVFKLVTKVWYLKWLLKCGI